MLSCEVLLEGIVSRQTFRQTNLSFNISGFRIVVNNPCLEIPLEIVARTGGFYFGSST